MKIILQTERVALREFAPADAAALAEILCDRENMRFYPRPFGPREVEEWIERSLARYTRDAFGLWAMILKSEQRLIGDCGLLIQEVDGARETEIGYHPHRAYQGQGLATEAACACRDHAFSVFKLARVISLIRPENLPSRGVAERVGMTVEKETIFRGFPHLVYALKSCAGGGVTR